MINKKLVRSLSMALALPSTILFSAIVSKGLVDSGALSWNYAAILFMIPIVATLFLMVYFTYINKK